MSILRRELAFKTGVGLLNEDTGSIFRKSALNIFNTQLFNFCRYEVDSLVPDSSGRISGRVVFHVSERWYTFPSPIFELADRNFNEWWYDRNADLRRVNMGLRFVQNNVRGRNEDLIVGIHGGFTHRLNFVYVIPYLDRKQRIGLRFSGSFANNRDVAVRSVGNRLVFKRDEESFGRERMNLALQLSARKSIYGYHFLDMAYHYNRISDFTFSQNPDYFLGRDFQRFSEIRYSFVDDHRNTRYFGTRGHWLSFIVTRYGILPQDNFRIWSARLAGSLYKPLLPWLFWASKADVEISSDVMQPYLGTRVLGFDNRFVRGYERYIMEGNYNLHSRNSLRFKFLTRQYHFPWVPLRQFRYVPLDLYLTPFYDFGYVHNSRVLEENRRLVNKFLMGYGMGLNLVTFYDVVFRAEYSFTLQGDRGLYFSFLTDI